MEPGVAVERCRRLENQISALKQVSSLRKNLLELRERQVKDLINKLKFYEVIVAEEREARHSLSSRLESAESKCGELTERLKQNCHTIDELKTNYENKVSTLINEVQTSEKRNQQLSDQINCAQLRITEVTKDCTMEELCKKLEDANKALDEKDKLTKDMQKQLKRVWERNKVLSYQMSLLNNLFSETEGVTIDFEKIKAIGDIVRESQTFAEETEEVLSDDEFSERRPSVDLENLIESMEKSENVIPAEIPGEESCYKSVDTKRGPQLVLSVSRTFIKLKDLIVEKKALQKEIETWKTLNTKLESKVDKQEHRLYRVTMELNKTWSLVSKLKQQHKRLYNSEAVLRYELQEKRALLEKLKNELSISREKWRRVRQKNSQSQIEWEKLRDEFAQRKHQSSQESGTFSEVMSVSSSGENDGGAFEDEDAPQGFRSRQGSRGNKLEKSKTLPMSFTTTVSANNNEDNDSTNDGGLAVPANFEEGDNDEGPAVEADFEGRAEALSPVEDEAYEDPLEDLVSQLVEDIDNEADTEDDSCSTSARTQLTNEEGSLPPEFEDRMRRRANRLQMLEEQCHILHKKLAASTERGVALSTKLANLHDHYGGPSASSTTTTTTTTTETPSDGSDHQTSTSQTEASAATTTTTHPHQRSSSSEEEAATSTSTDTAYVTGTENNSVREDTDNVDVPKRNENEEGASRNLNEMRCNESSPSNEIDSGKESENSPTIVASSASTSSSSDASTEENNKNPTEEKLEKIEAATGSSQQPQGRLNCIDDNNLLTTVKNVITSSSSNGTLPDANVDSSDVTGGAGDCADSAEITASDASPAVTSEICNDLQSMMPTPALVTLPESSSRDLQNQSTTDNTNTERVLNCDLNSNDSGLEQSSQQNHESSEVNGTISEDFTQTSSLASASTVTTEQIAEISRSEEVSQSQVTEEVVSTEEPLPIIQETVVQHFPTTAEEEANEFAPVQIRPEFLRILQEADDDGANVGSLDWMPSLLTITHSVALLRLDQESPSTSRNNNSRSVSESLRIEIPRQSPSPPPVTIRQQQRRDRNGGGGRSGSNRTDGHVSAEEDNNVETEEASVPRKDPSFLSRMIIKQLPKRLQILKNENHTLQMEAAEAKMRMREMKRQLTKEMDKQQQLANSLDTQIEDKNLIEFELREELEQKEKVIEELQVEIDESKKYVDELKKEKDDAEAFLKVFMDEKMDLSQPKVPPETVKNCNNCKRPFLLLTRRKLHCKICGKVFCKDCALQREPNRRSSKRPRLCTRCHLRRLRLVVLVNASKKSTSTAQQEQPN